MLKEEIVIKNENLPIEKGFTLEGLKRFNVIVGKNNSGKTRFFNSIEKQYGKDGDIHIVCIPANEVKPEEDHYKSSATASFLVKILSELFGDNIQLDKSEEVKKDIKSFFKDIGDNFKEVCSKDDCGLNIELEDKLNSKEIIKSMIKSITTDIQDEKENFIKLGDVGQGYQRMFIASLLQVYAERGVNNNQPILILFEEPELFLHPELKRNVNKALKKISSLVNHQVIITTHDPYFLWSNMDDEETQTYSFSIGEDKKTKVSKENVGLGVEDEMLHISLFSRMLKLIKEKEMPHGFGANGMKNTSDKLIELGTEDKYKFTTKEYKLDKKSYDVILPIYIRNKIHHPENADNSYKDEELAKSIEDLIYLLRVLSKTSE